MVNGSISRWRLVMSGIPSGLCLGTPALEYLNQFHRVGLSAHSVWRRECQTGRSGQTWDMGSRPVHLFLLYAPLGVLNPALGSSAQERCESAGLTPEEGHKDDQGTEVSLLWSQAERDGVVQHGDGKALGRPYWNFSKLRGLIKKVIGPVETLFNYKRELY